MHKNCFNYLIIQIHSQEELCGTIRNRQTTIVIRRPLDLDKHNFSKVSPPGSHFSPRSRTREGPALFVQGGSVFWPRGRSGASNWVLRSVTHSSLEFSESLRLWQIKMFLLTLTKEMILQGRRLLPTSHLHCLSLGQDLVKGCLAI